MWTDRKDEPFILVGAAGDRSAIAAGHVRACVSGVGRELALARALIALGKNEQAKPVLTAGIVAASSGRSSGSMDLIPEMRALLQSLSTATP